MLKSLRPAIAAFLVFSLPSPSIAAVPKDAKETFVNWEGYRRGEEQTYLTLPEWYIVYNYDEYAAFLQNHAPSGFPYGDSIVEFWSVYAATCSVIKDRYPVNWGYHGMILVIGASFTVENAVKGIYENTVGRFTEWLAGGEPTDEDVFIRESEAEYGAFTHFHPWYEFPFAKRLEDFWVRTPLSGEHMPRKWERKLFLTVQYSLKTAYSRIIGAGTQAAYEAEDDVIYARIRNAPLDGAPIVEKFADGSVLVKLPRYEPFQDAVKALARGGTEFVEIAGNDEILVTAIVKRDGTPDFGGGEFLFESRVVTRPELKRVALRAPVAHLSRILARLEGSGAAVEHLYDY